MKIQARSENVSIEVDVNIDAYFDGDPFLKQMFVELVWPRVEIYFQALASQTDAAMHSGPLMMLFIDMMIDASKRTLSRMKEDLDRAESGVHPLVLIEEHKREDQLEGKLNTGPFSDFMSDFGDLEE